MKLKITCINNSGGVAILVSHSAFLIFFTASGIIKVSDNTPISNIKDSILIIDGLEAILERKNDTSYTGVLLPMKGTWTAETIEI